VLTVNYKMLHFVVQVK